MEAMDPVAMVVLAGCGAALYRAIRLRMRLRHIMRFKLGTIGERE